MNRSSHSPRPAPLLTTALLAFGIAAVLALGAAGLRSAEVPPPDPVRGILPVGTILAYGGPAASVPESGGWLLCDGRELPVVQFPDLHAVLGVAWGGVPGDALFRIPDMRGRFLRGVSYAAGDDLRDPDRAARGTSGPGGNSGNEVGSLQEDAAGPHQHPVSGVADAIGPGTGAEWIRFHGAKVPDDAAPVLSNTWSVQPSSGSETRPRNVYVNWIIRAR